MKIYLILMLLHLCYYSSIFLKLYAQHTIEINSIKDSWAFSEPNNIKNNFDSDPKLTLISYTYSGNIGTGRTYLDFDLDKIPKGAEIIEVQLKLYGYVDNPPVHKHEGENAFSIQRIISDWDEKTLNWGNQPLTTMDDQVIINRKSTSPFEDYTIDVTQMIKVMYDNRSTNFGMKLQFLEEKPYKQLEFTSTSNKRIDKHPKLVVKYNLIEPFTITTDSIIPSEYCAGDTLFISYTTQKEFESDNKFKAILSDENGIFDLPTVIGNYNSKSSGTILGILPTELPKGTNYRVRVVSSNPQEVGSISPTPLIINPLPPKPIISRKDNLLISNSPIGNLWFDEKGVIPGATDRIFIPSHPGKYYVVVTLNNCSNKSEIFVLTDLDKILSQKYSYTFYPNPTSETMIVNVGKPCDLEIFNMQGVQLLNFPVQIGEQSINISSLSTGVYIVKFNLEANEYLIKKLVIH